MLENWQPDAKVQLLEGEAGATIMSAVTLLAGSLQELSLGNCGVWLPPPGSWLAPLGRLTSLQLNYGTGDVEMADPLAGPTALQRLWLYVCDGSLTWQPQAALPPALTRLWLRFAEDPIPTQVRKVQCSRTSCACVWIRLPCRQGCLLHGANTLRLACGWTANRLPRLLHSSIHICLPVPSCSWELCATCKS